MARTKIAIQLKNPRTLGRNLLEAGSPILVGEIPAGIKPEEILAAIRQGACELRPPSVDPAAARAAAEKAEAEKAAGDKAAAEAAEAEMAAAEKAEADKAAAEKATKK